MKNNRITDLFGIEYPIIQGGMVWCSGWRLASAVSNAGGLGLLGAGSMHPQTMKEHIHKMKEATTKPWGVNVPLMYPELDALITRNRRKRPGCCKIHDVLQDGERIYRCSNTHGAGQLWRIHDKLHPHFWKSCKADDRSDGTYQWPDGQIH